MKAIVIIVSSYVLYKPTMGIYSILLGVQVFTRRARLSDTYCSLHSPGRSTSILPSGGGICDAASSASQGARWETATTEVRDE